MQCPATPISNFSQTRVQEQMQERCCKDRTPLLLLLPLLAGAPLAGERCPGVRAPEGMAGLDEPKPGAVTVKHARGLAAANHRSGGGGGSPSGHDYGAGTGGRGPLSAKRITVAAWLLRCWLRRRPAFGRLRRPAGPGRDPEGFCRRVRSNPGFAVVLR